MWGATGRLCCNGDGKDLGRFFFSHPQLCIQPPIQPAFNDCVKQGLARSCWPEISMCVCVCGQQSVSVAVSYYAFSIFLPLFHSYHPRRQRKLFVLSRYFDSNTLTSESFLTLETLPSPGLSVPRDGKGFAFHVQVEQSRSTPQPPLDGTLMVWATNPLS